MILRSLRLQNFRNLDGTYQLSKGLNIIIAPNGKGKTNFLEAIVFISRGKSFKTNNEILTVKNDFSDKAPFKFARIDAEIEDGLGNTLKKELVLEVRSEESIRKTLIVNFSKTTLGKFDDTFHAIIFSPNTVDLVIGSPQIRRKDLDDFLSVVDEEYFLLISEYRKVLRQRNKVLERLLVRKGNDRELDFWDEKMLVIGSRIILKRAEFFRDIKEQVSKYAFRLFNLHGAELSIIYESKFLAKVDEKNIYNLFKNKLIANKKKEIWAGKSLYGPQRDDFSFYLNNLNVKDMGSRGQQRLCAYIYKVAQKEHMKKFKNVEPVFLLDDLFSELDVHVRAKIIDFVLESNAQVVLTALSRDEVNDKLLDKAEFIKL
ncbi:MAG: DNA replication and repair protein RecF [Candidatus Dojkabacteria bacterium]|nr:DNA replication and repair protein RecF [Candidatus Dojkabacteria bacterium]